MTVHLSPTLAFPAYNLVNFAIKKQTAEYREEKNRKERKVYVWQGLYMPRVHNNYLLNSIIIQGCCPQYAAVLQFGNFDLQTLG